MRCDVQNTFQKDQPGCYVENKPWEVRVDVGRPLGGYCSDPGKNDALKMINNQSYNVPGKCL